MKAETIYISKYSDTERSLRFVGFSSNPNQMGEQIPIIVDNELAERMFEQLGTQLYGKHFTTLAGVRKEQIRNAR